MGPYRHNRLRLIEGGADYFSCLEQLIGEATHSVYLQTYIFEADDTGRSVARALQQAAGRGVFVHLLVDGFASQHLPGDFIQELKGAGVDFRFFEPLFKSKSYYFGRRLHHKVLVVDGRYAVVGGINISDKYNDTVEHTAWLDFAVRVEGEAARALYNICASRAISPWKLPTTVSIPTPPAFQPPAEECQVYIRVNDWVRRKFEISRSYTNTLQQAVEHVYIISSYFVPGRKIRKQLAEAAKRGVSVVVLVTGESDVTVAKFAERYIYRWLFAKGIEVYEYQGGVLHAKLSVCDSRWTMIGSYNMNELSDRASVELNLEIIDKPFAVSVEAYISSLIATRCQRVSPDGYRSQFNFLERLFQWGAYKVLQAILVVFTFYFRHRE